MAEELVTDATALESEIDRLVYQFFGLTEEEFDFIIRSAFGRLP